jgi:hypothetical protein
MQNQPNFIQIRAKYNLAKIEIKKCQQNLDKIRVNLTNIKLGNYFGQIKKKIFFQDLSGLHLDTILNKIRLQL